MYEVEITIENTITRDLLIFNEEAESFVKQCWEKVISDSVTLTIFAESKHDRYHKARHWFKANKSRDNRWLDS